MDHEKAALRAEIAELRRELDRLRAGTVLAAPGSRPRHRPGLIRRLMAGDAVTAPADGSDPQPARPSTQPAAPIRLDEVWIVADDDDEARAFDEFYGAYDEAHAKIRKFLLD